MSDIVISVENISKEYHLGTVSHNTMRKDMESWWARMRGKEDPNALVDTGVSSPFTIHSSQSVKSKTSSPFTIHSDMVVSCQAEKRLPAHCCQWLC